MKEKLKYRCFDNTNVKIIIFYVFHFTCNQCRNSLNNYNIVYECADII